jgi:hypothetical protein
MAPGSLGCVMRAGAFALLDGGLDRATEQAFRCVMRAARADDLQSCEMSFE